MWKRTMKLKTRIKIAFIAIMSIVLALNTAIILFYISDSLKKNAEASMESINEQKMITIENLMDTFVTLTQKPLIDDTILAVLKRDYSTYPEEKQRFYRYQDMSIMDERLYAEMFYKNEYIYAVTILLGDGERTYSKQRSGKGVLEIDFKNMLWFQKLYATDGTEAVLFPYMEEDLYRGREPIIAVGRLLKDPLTNQPLGLVRVDIAVKDLERVWEGESLSGNGNILFKDQEGKLLYTSLDIDDWEREYEEALKTDIAVTSDSKKYGVSVTSLLPKKELYQKTYNTILIILGIAVGCIFIALILTEFIVKRSLQPIRRLNGLMKKVRCGDLRVRAEVQGVGEFEEVCESFNLMVENTEHLIERIRLEESEKMEAEYQALQAQISPHFILNTMSTIRWLAIIQGNKSIEKALDSFSHLLTFAVRQKEEKILIRTELEQMKYYVDILSLRYYDKFQIDFRVDEEANNCCTIKFLLQTLVENSVFHGFDEMSGKGRILVTIRRVEDEISYEVRDNGKGITKERIEEVLSHAQEEKKGMIKIGIYNINRRIKLIFGQSYGVTIESVPGEYTVVRVVIPAQEEAVGENHNC